MSLNALGLGFMFTATDLASGVMNNIKQNFQGLEDAANTKVDNLDKLTRRMGAGLTAAFVGIGGLAGTFKLAKSAGDFEKAMTLVQVKTHATEAQMKALQKVAYDMGQQLGVAPVDAAMGMKLMGQQGYQVNKIIEQLPLLTKFAAAGDIDLSEAIDLVSQSMRTFKIDSELMTRAMDQMLQSVDMSSGDIKELPIGLARALSGAKLYNMTLTDTLMIFNAIKDIVASPMLAGTGTSYIGSRLANPKYANILKQLTHLDIIDKKTGDPRDIIEVLKELGPILDKMSIPKKAEVLSKVFGQDGSRGVMAFFSRLKAGWEDADGTVHKGVEGMLFNMDKIAGANGNVERLSEKMMKTFNKMIDRLSGATKVALIELGKPFLEAWKPILDKAIDMLTKFAKALADTDPETKLMIAQALTVGTAFLALFGILGTLGAALPLLWSGIELIATALWGFIPAIFTAVVALGWWLPVLAGLGVIIYAVSKNMGGMGQVWHRVVAAFGGAKGILDGIVDFFKNAWLGISDGFMYMIDSMDFTFIAKSFNDLFDSVGDLMAEFGWFMPSGGGSKVRAFFEIIGKLIGWVAGITAYLIGFVAKLGSIFANIVYWVIKPALVLLYSMLVGWWLEPILAIAHAMGKLQDIKSPGKALGAWFNTEHHQPKTDWEGSSGTRSDWDGRQISVDKDYEGQNLLAPKDRRSYQDASYGPAATASFALSRSTYEGTQPGRTEELINYEKLAEVMSSLPPPQINMDGEKMLMSLDNTRRRVSHGISGSW